MKDEKEKKTKETAKEEETKKEEEDDNYGRLPPRRLILQSRFWSRVAGFSRSACRLVVLRASESLTRIKDGEGRRDKEQ